MRSIEYGIPTDKCGAELRLGIEKGFFHDEGLDLTIRLVFGGPEIAAMYSSGALKIGEIGTPPATTAIARGARFKIVGSGIRRRALQYFVAAPKIGGWDDLHGASIGVLSAGSCSCWFARLVLERHDLDPDEDARIIGLGPRYQDVIELIEQDELQAAVISEPNVSIGEYRKVFHILKALTDPEFCPRMQWMVTVANCDVIERDPELVRAVLRACRHSYHYAADNPDEFARFCAQLFGASVPTMRHAMERDRQDMHYDCEIDLAGLDLAIDLQRRLGAFSTELRASDITDLSHLPTRTPALDATAPA
jgi:ABC-type nitrate/sulfonate/bicarbonate transport system substrate-binding protein